MITPEVGKRYLYRNLFGTVYHVQVLGVIEPYLVQVLYTVHINGFMGECNVERVGYKWLSRLMEDRWQ